MLHTISHYSMIRLLGAGGMGEIYLALDTKLNRKVAIKLLSPQSVTDTIANKRLIREARAAARLDHPNICAIYEVGEENNRAFIVMQYLQGETLADRIARRPLELSETLAIASQVADALLEAHVHGIIHRDLKPQNVMITPRGQAKVLDFGLAKLTERASPVDSEAETETLLSQPGAILGTVPYLSPEQLEEKDLDNRSDIFSFGSMLYEMVTGKPAFAASGKGAVVSAILNKDPQPLARYAANVPSELERILRKCIVKDREQRYQSARELFIDLRNLEADVGSATVATDGILSHARPGLVRFALASLAVVIFALLSYALYLLATSNKPKHKEIESVAVLPFTNANADPRIEYLSEGITDSIINSLSELPNLKVIARSSVFRYKERAVDVQVAGRELNVQAVLTGRLIQQEENLFISAELADVSDNTHIWGTQLNRRLSDVLTVQEEISRGITEKLRPTVSKEQAKLLTKPYTENREAYLFYLKGRYLWNKRTPEEVKRSIELFGQALQEDPLYAMAYAGLADSYSLLGDYGALPPKEGFQKAKAAATKALEIDDKLAEAHTSLAHAELYEWRWPDAEKEYRRAIELKPGYATAHQWYANHLVALGRFNEAHTEMSLALEIDPLSLIINEVAGLHLYLSRKYDSAIAQLQKTVELDANFIPAHATLGQAYLQKHMYGDAVGEIQKAVAISGRNPDYLADLGYAYAVSGDKRKARMILDELTYMSSRRYVSPYCKAVVYSGLDEKEQALKWLENAYADRSSELMFIKGDPIFDKVRTDSRFLDLLRGMGLSR
jgi:serine/threonine-protein kinase